MMRFKYIQFIAVIIGLIVVLPVQSVADHIAGGKVSLRLSTISAFKPFVSSDEAGTIHKINSTCLD